MTDVNRSDTTDVVEVSIKAFRNFTTFIVEHDLWDEAKEELEAAGIDNVVLGGPLVHTICKFVEEKGAELQNNWDYNHEVAVPRCMKKSA